MRRLLSDFVLAVQAEQDRPQLGFHGGLLALLALTDVSILTPMLAVGHWTLAAFLSVVLLSTFVGIPVWFAHRWRTSLLVPAEPQPWLFRERFGVLWNGFLGILLVLLGIRLGAGPAALVIVAGLVFLGVASHAGWRYARGALPVGVSRGAPQTEMEDSIPPHLGMMDENTPTQAHLIPTVSEDSESVSPPAL